VSDLISSDSDDGRAATGNKGRSVAGRAGHAASNGGGAGSGGKAGHGSTSDGSGAGSDGGSSWREKLSLRHDSARHSPSGKGTSGAGGGNAHVGNGGSGGKEAGGVVVVGGVAWRQFRDGPSGRPYWFDEVSGSSSWVRPGTGALAGTTGNGGLAAAPNTAPMAET